MKYKKLPLEKELESLAENEGDAAMAAARSVHVEALIRSPGFQIIVTLLRDFERSALSALRSANGNPTEAAARIHTIDLIRRAIEGIVPSLQVDWAEEEIEEFLPPDIASFD